MNPLLESLISQFSVQAQELLDLLEARRITPKVWRDRMAMLLARYHSAAMMTGIGSINLPVEGIAILEATLASQYGFLQRFYTEVAAAEAFKASWRARSNLYALSPKESYWEGYIYNKAGRFLPLPAMPAQGTQCYTNCGCGWRLQEVDRENVDWDAYWERGKNDSCQTCLEREQQWNPVRIRGNVLQV